MASIKLVEIKMLNLADGGNLPKANQSFSFKLELRCDEFKRYGFL